MEQAEMPSFVLHTMEQHLTMTLNLDSRQQYNIRQELTPTEQTSLCNAVHHQTLLGWHSFLCGYISNFWNKLAVKTRTTKKQYWESKLTSISLNLHKTIWEGRNCHVHGANVKEAKQRAREAIITKIKKLYKTPPRLASRYQSILSVPLEIRIRKSTAQLQDWLNKIRHQQRVSEILHSTLPPGQLTLQQAFARGTKNNDQPLKYPP